MRPPKHLIRALLICALIYSLLLAPWPGWASAYSAYLRALAGATLGRTVLVETLPPGAPHGADTRFVITVPALMQPDGSGPTRNLELDARSIFWKPLALLLALTLATPLPIRRRLIAAGCGVVLYQVFLIGFLALVISHEVATLRGELSLWSEATRPLQSLLVDQYLIGVPALLWLLTTVRSRDLSATRLMRASA